MVVLVVVLILIAVGAIIGFIGKSQDTPQFAVGMNGMRGFGGGSPHYGLITLVGGALWSAWLFLRKRVLPNRVIGNVLIAVGALSKGLASTLTRFGVGEFLYVRELVAAVLMYGGFVVASAPAAEEEGRLVPDIGSPLSVDA